MLSIRWRTGQSRRCLSRVMLSLLAFLGILVSRLVISTLVFALAILGRQMPSMWLNWRPTKLPSLIRVVSYLLLGLWSKGESLPFALGRALTSATQAICLVPILRRRLTRAPIRVRKGVAPC